MHMASTITAQQSVLFRARKTYSHCAAIVETRIQATGYSQILSDQIIGVGVAADWIRRSAEMEDIRYVGGQLNGSPRKRSFVELVRYRFSWFALNSIFSRPALLNVIGVPRLADSEYEHFLVLFNCANIPTAAARLKDLHSLLAATTSPRMPGVPTGTTVRTLSAIHAKYLSSTPPRGTTAKAVAAAVATGNLSTLDLPTLLYAFRNWSVHGNALDGSFGTRPGFLKYVGILHDTLADVHLNTATLLAKRL